MDAVAALRHELPALGLTLGFADRSTRATIADILLLWLELNRARSASEGLIAAARITWWREAFDQGKPEGVPLAERLLKQDKIAVSSLSQMLSEVTNLTLDQASDGAVMHYFAPPITNALGGDANELAHILLSFKMALIGTPAELPPLKSDLPPPFKLMAWLAQDPSRLNYPQEKPLLALSMLMASLRG